MSVLQKSAIALRQNSKGKQCFQATLPLEFVVIDILDQFLTIKRWNWLLLAITNRFLKLVKINSFTNISAGTAAKLSSAKASSCMGRKKRIYPTIGLSIRSSASNTYAEFSVYPTRSRRRTIRSLTSYVIR